MRDAIMLERKIEFAFENKRYADLRRRRAFEEVLNGRVRHRNTYILRETTPAEFRSVRDAIDLSGGKFDEVFSTTTEPIDDIQINFKPEYYFYAIPPQHLELNPNLQQTTGWDGGAFDPLQ